ncbi:hypothetical protein AB0J40_29040 [Amycolatopsis sp. NPDC049691]|uniref:hypothetical protein n=1 Tax=Amycolatopsis sp. NPDC049691 TaxID=3155155 RepID=UPI00342893E7
MIAVVLALIASGTAVWLFRIAASHGRSVKIKILCVSVESENRPVEIIRKPEKNQLDATPVSPDEQEESKRNS